jgi:hypothetical protein
MSGFKVYELIVLDDQNEFNQDLLDMSDDGQVPIYLADITKLVSDQNGDAGLNLVAVSAGKPIDPAELQAKVSEYLDEDEEEEMVASRVQALTPA